MVDKVGIAAVELEPEKVLALVTAPDMLDRDTALGFGVVPVRHDTPRSVALITPQVPSDTDMARLRFLLRREVSFIVTDQHTFNRIVLKAWPDAAMVSHEGSSENGFKARLAGSQGGGRDTSDVRTDDISPVQIVDDLFSRAIAIGASDIHFEPTEMELQVRFRLDGVLQPVASVPKSRQNEALSRLKILANMDIAEKRRPQDGRIVVDGREKSVDVRVSSMPTPHGEKIVLRLLDKSQQVLDLEMLGMEGRNLEMFTEAIKKPHGMILVTGPTGSGKTTTLYAALKAIQSPRINISTVEDPIEYQLPGINQTQMHGDIGYTFAAAVRTFLRQDPDVIMIGEIRDPETAKYAIQAAQTGHLVFSTLHTNDAPSAIVRLLEMDMEPYLVASTVHLIMAQRLVRKICRKCVEEYTPGDAERSYLAGAGLDTARVHRGKGCAECAGSGYRGRIGVFEIMRVSPHVQDMVLNKVSTHTVREKALEEGMSSLRMEALRLVEEGITGVEEVKSVIG